MSNRRHLSETRGHIVLEAIQEEIAVLARRAEEIQSTIKKAQEEYDTTVAELNELRRQASFWAKKSGVGLTDDHNIVSFGKTALERVIEGSYADAAKRILEEARGPLPTGKIAELLFEEGRPMPSEPKARRTVVYSALWRRRKEGRDFLLLAPGIWGLMDRDEDKDVSDIEED